MGINQQCGFITITVNPDVQQQQQQQQQLITNHCGTHG